MKRKMKYSFGSALCLVLTVVLLSLSLYGCDENDIPSITETAETTESPVTTQSPLVTDPTVEHTFDQAQMDKFLALVDYGKLLQVQEIFETLYIGEYKPYSEIGTEVIKAIAETIDLEEITTVEALQQHVT